MPHVYLNFTQIIIIIYYVTFLVIQYVVVNATWIVKEACTKCFHKDNGLFCMLCLLL